MDNPNVNYLEMYYRAVEYNRLAEKMERADREKEDFSEIFKKFLTSEEFRLFTELNGAGSEILKEDPISFVTLLDMYKGLHKAHTRNLAGLLKTTRFYDVIRWFRLKRALKKLKKYKLSLGFYGELLKKYETNYLDLVTRKSSIKGNISKQEE